MDLVTLMGSIAEAIRAKTGSTEKINAQDFPQKINEIKGSPTEKGNYKEIIYNENNTVTLIDHEGTAYIVLCE
jgi:hypothetical protein